MNTPPWHGRRCLRLEALEQRRVLSVGANWLAPAPSAEPAADTSATLLGTAKAQTEDHKLTASDAAAVDQFGESVSIIGQTAIIGAPGNDDGGHDSGSAYMFRFEGNRWIEQQKLTASDAAAGDDFGEFVVLSGNTAMVAAPMNDGAALDAGAVYVFRFDGSRWVEVAELRASDEAPRDDFGRAIAFHGGTFLVGARANNQAGPNSGAAYVFYLPTVLGRHAFYNNSAFDGNDAAAGPDDDAAIASDKWALPPGGTGTLVN